jgi:hypothetical protein
MPAPDSLPAQVSALALLVPRFAADDAHGAIATNDLAVTAHFLYRSSNFHRSFSKIASRRTEWTGGAFQHPLAALSA